MRVLMLSWEYPPHVVGGMGRHVMELVPALAQEQIEIQIVTPLLRGGPEAEHTPTGIAITRVEPPHMEEYGFFAFVQQSNLLLERAARQLAWAGKPFDLIHTHDWLAAHAAIELKHAWRIPLLATIHATERGRHQGHLGDSHAEQINGLEWQLSYEAWRVIVCSQFMAGQVQEYFQTPADKVDVVHNGISLPASPFTSQAEQQSFRRRFVAEDQPLVFYVGRVVYEKGLHVLLAAWPQIMAAYPGARLLIAGTGSMLDELKRQARELGMEGAVIFTGYVSDIDRERLYQIADVAVFPSIYEPFGIVALEAMAAGCPVVVAETGGLREVVQPHQTGLTVRADDPAALAWGILHTLDHPDWSRARADNALRDVGERFTWASVAGATAAIYAHTRAAWQASPWGKELARRPGGFAGG